MKKKLFWSYSPIYVSHCRNIFYFFRSSSMVNVCRCEFFSQVHRFRSSWSSQVIIPLIWWYLNYVKDKFFNVSETLRNKVLRKSELATLLEGASNQFSKIIEDKNFLILLWCFTCGKLAVNVKVSCIKCSRTSVMLIWHVKNIKTVRHVQ